MEGKRMSANDDQNYSEDKNENSENPILKIPSGYRLAKDNLGNDAFICDEESKHLGFTDENISLSSQPSPQKTAPVCIKIQTQPDKLTFSSLATLDDVYRRIQEVIELQSKYRLSRLYERRWRRRMKNDDNDYINKEEGGGTKSGNNCSNDGGEDTKPSSWCFAVAQFNALAEGLSSSSKSSSMPFPPTSKAGDENNNKHFPGGEYGGFTSVPNSEICLNFNLRKWRLLEVLLGGGIAIEDDENKQNEPTVEQKQNSLSRLPPFDIIAMEEIDHYHNFFQPILSKFFGYDGFFIPKPSSPSTKLGWYSDGCALFYKKDAFEIVSEKEGVYDVGTQVYLIVALRHRESGHVLVVATTHLKAKESKLNERIRTAQAIQLFEMVCAVADEVGGMGKAMKKEGNIECVGGSGDKENGRRSHQSDIPIIIMGDFNADPVGEGRTCIQSVNAKSHSSCSFSSLCSAYQIDPPPDALFTTWKTRGTTTVRRIIDYIFYHSGHDFVQAGYCNSENPKAGVNREENNHDDTTESGNNAGSSARMQCTHILDVPNDHEIEVERLPGFRYPSDHMMIAARFKLNSVQPY